MILINPGYVYSYSGFLHYKSLSMNKIKITKSYEEYCLNDINFRTDLPQLIDEIQKCSGQQLYVPVLNILRSQLAVLAERAIDLDDPYLNIIMLKLKLYEVPHKEIQNKIKEQQERILNTYSKEKK